MRGDIFYLGGDFVAVVMEVEVDDLELEVGVVIRLVWGCLNGRLYFFWRLSRMSMEGKKSNVGECPVGMVMREDFLMELFFIDASCLGKVTGSKMKTYPCFWPHLTKIAWAKTWSVREHLISQLLWVAA